MLPLLLIKHLLWSDLLGLEDHGCWTVLLLNLRSCGLQLLDWLHSLRLDELQQLEVVSSGIEVNGLWVWVNLVHGGVLVATGMLGQHQLVDAVLMMSMVAFLLLVSLGGVDLALVLKDHAEAGLVQWYLLALRVESWDHWLGGLSYSSEVVVRIEALRWRQVDVLGRCCFGLMLLLLVGYLINITIYTQEINELEIQFS